MEKKFDYNEYKRQVVAQDVARFRQKGYKPRWYENIPLIGFYLYLFRLSVIEMSIDRGTLRKNIYVSYLKVLFGGLVFITFFLMLLTPWVICLAYYLGIKKTEKVLDDKNHQFLQVNDAEIKGQEFNFDEYKRIVVTSDVARFKSKGYKPRWYENIPFFGTFAYNIRTTILMVSIDRGTLRKNIYTTYLKLYFGGLIIISIGLFILTPWFKFIAYHQGIKKTEANLKDANPQFLEVNNASVYQKPLANYDEYKKLVVTSDVARFKRNGYKPRWYENIPVLGSYAYVIRMSILSTSIDRGTLRKNIYTTFLKVYFGGLCFIPLFLIFLTPWFMFLVYLFAIKKTERMLNDNSAQL